MTKKELLKYKQYFTCPSFIIDELYKDDEEIPKEIIELMFHKPEDKEYKLLISSKLYDKFIKILKDEMERQNIKIKRRG